MSTEIETTGTESQVQADLEAGMRHVADGTPVQPELARRVRERAARVMEEIRREHGDLDVVKLLHDARADA